MTTLMIGIEGLTLTKQDKKLLQHPLVSGVIFFARNYENYQQLRHLTQQIRAIRGENFLLAVDQEGGRVIRFRAPFSQLPALGLLGNRHQSNQEQGLALTHLHAWIMAAELLNTDIDLSFSPVLDINNGSDVIGDRAFSQNPHEVIELAKMYSGSMHAAGMKTTAKHYPGHGTVKADSHHHITQDERPQHMIENLDLVPFRTLITANKVDAVMMSHVIYSDVDDQPAGFSKKWIKHLRETVHFQGVIISDDLAMTGATGIGGLKQRYLACREAQVDLALLCQPELCAELLPQINHHDAPGYSQSLRRLHKLKGHSTLNKERPFWEQQRWQQATKAFKALKEL
ncbi:beta-N-acetylhexosaminidase [Marinicella gelatinilytica]|uniref:beta-N-acetylhexosaminidase n=1 Tax=Marinicella gelatinilytica TaxID=2996017 RepID=UPI002260A12D|nr:beta-N-acetylhexosaminidase [Marinicella gelatinilytica]MCX7544391.1 beta-N-acetylhexosaminidase [Marinicella gelatinilytica]